MTRENVALIAPFAAWMLVLTLLATFSTPWSYAINTAVTLALLVWSWHQLGCPRTCPLKALAWGIPAGLLVLALWVVPEKLFDGYSRLFVLGNTMNAPVDASTGAVKIIRLFGSAFVISIAEELFFRRWLMRHAGFLWMVALFAAEHNRWLAAAITGAIYGWVALRKGLPSAIIAHVTTNLTLGIYVLVTGDWGFW